MPLNEQKVVAIILDECNSIEERCNGYKEELVETIVDIIALERQHRIQGTNIQQKISDKCNATGNFLAKLRGQTQIIEEDF